MGAVVFIKRYSNRTEWFICRGAAAVLLQQQDSDVRLETRGQCGSVTVEVCGGPSQPLWLVTL